MDKMVNVLEWRRKNHSPDLPHWMELAKDHTTQPESIVDSHIWTRIQALTSTLNTNSTYFHGHTRDGRPIMWVRVGRKHRWPDVDGEIHALGVLFDAAISHGMPNHNTDFCVIAHVTNPPPPHPKCGFRMLQGLVEGYPDRMHVLMASPVSRIVEVLMGWLLPFMPGRLAEKFVFLSLDHMKERLEEVMPVEDIPTFFGGTANHDLYYPQERDCPTRGDGILKFDYFGLIQRLQQQKEDFEETTTASKKKRVSFAISSNGNGNVGYNGGGDEDGV